MNRFFLFFVLNIVLATTIVHADEPINIPVNFSFINDSGKLYQKSIITKEDSYSLKDENGKNRDLTWIPHGQSMLLPLLEKIVDLSNNLEIQKQEECDYILTARLDCQTKSPSIQEQNAGQYKSVNESFAISLGKYCSFGPGLQTQNTTKIDFVEVMDLSQNSSDNIQDVYQIYIKQDEEIRTVETFPIDDAVNFQFEHVSSRFIEKVADVKRQLESKMK